MILIYHVVSDDSRFLYSVTHRTLDEHLRFLAERGAGKRRDGEARVTFDDGHISQYESALPLLEQYAVRANFFVTPEWTGNRAGFMSWTHLRELVRLGHGVESHGWSHKPFTRCSASELATELRRSKQVLEDRLGVPVDAVAVPDGEWNHRVLGECAAAGYKRMYTSDLFLHHVDGTGLELLGRVGVKDAMNSAALARIARAETRPFSAIRLRHLAKRAARAALGYSLYHQLWCRLAHFDPNELEYQPDGNIPGGIR